MQVDIYWWQGQENRYWQYLCRLVAKAVAADFSVLVLTANQAMAKQLDELLWSYSVTQFIPHHYLHIDNPDQEIPLEQRIHRVPVLIVDAPKRYMLSSAKNKCLLLNTCVETYTQGDDFGRLVELLPLTERSYPEMKERIACYQSIADPFHEYELAPPNPIQPS